MAVRDQLITPKFAIYNADCMAVMQDMPAASVHLSVYSPPFASAGVGGLYVYSSDPLARRPARPHDRCPCQIPPNRPPPHCVAPTHVTGAGRRAHA